MNIKRKLITGKIVLVWLSILILSSCAHRYTKIPRQFTLNKSSKSKTFQSGHYVRSEDHKIWDSTASKELITARSEIAPQSNGDKSKTNASEPDDKNDSKTQKPSQQFTIAPAREIHPTDSITKWRPKRELEVGAVALLSVFVTANMLYLVAPSVSFMVIGFLLGIGLLAMGYFIAKFVKEAKRTRISPKKIRPHNFGPDSSLGRAFKILMLLSAIFLIISLVALGLWWWDLSFFFAVIGFVCLFSGLFVGILYLALNF